MCCNAFTGSYQDLYQQSTCKPTPPGTYTPWSPIHGNPAALGCPSRTVAPYSGMTTCFACDTKATSSPDGTKCNCAAGFYAETPSGHISFNTSVLRCQPCPTGAKCIESGVTWVSVVCMFMFV